MSPLYLTEADVTTLLDMRASIDALETVFRAQASGQAKNSPRQRAEYWGGRLNMMSAGASSGRFAFKAYAATKQPTVYHVLLYSLDGGLLAIIEAGVLGQLRTGAATGVATNHMSPMSASIVGCVGAGRQARTQLLAIAAVRKLKEIRVHARDGARLASFCDAMSHELHLPVLPARDGESCVAGADIVVTATTSSTPVVMDRWLPANVHINAMGANGIGRSELEIASYVRADRIVTDDKDQARKEAGEIVTITNEGKKSWDDIVEISRVVLEPAPAARAGFTIFKSLGAGLEDLAVASIIYDRAIAAGHDRRLPG